MLPMAKAEVSATSQAVYYSWPNGITGPVLFANNQWAVTRVGLESLVADCVISRSSLTKHHHEWDRCSFWIMHLAEKAWVDLGELTEAFSQALNIHRVKGRTLLDVRQSFERATTNRKNDRRFAEFYRKLVGDDGPIIASAEDMQAAKELFQESCAQRDVGGRPPAYRPGFSDEARILFDRGASREEVARHFGVSSRTVSRWLKGISEFSGARTKSREERRHQSLRKWQGRDADQIT